MNPAILSYLLSQQANPQQVEMQAQAQPQAMQFQAPQPQQQMPAQQGATQQAPYNPFEVGIKNAINSARESLDMTEKQQHKAMRRAMLSFGNNMSQQPVRKGFWNNFGAAGAAVGAGLGAYDEAEDLAIKENNQLANQILGYDAAHRAEQERAEETEWRRRFAEDQLAEKARHHDMMGQRSLGRGIASGGEMSNDSPVSQYVPITTNAQFNAASKLKTSTGNALGELNEVEAKYAKFKKDYENNIFEPLSAYSKVANPVKDIIGKFANNKAYRDETADRDALSAEVKRFNTGAERSLKGSGPVGIGILNYFDKENMFPNMDKDVRESFEAKLKGVKETLERAHKAALYSMKYGVQLDPSEVEDFEKNVVHGMQPSFDEGYKNMPRGGQTILLQDASGNQLNIPIDDKMAIQEAIDDGFSQVAQ